MKVIELEPRNESLQTHMHRTYQNLRVGLCVIAFLVPILVWVSDWIELSSLWPRDSISAYYHSEHSLTRDLFVGNLFAIGIFLLLYRGYSMSENLWLDVAGVLLTGVALFPDMPQEVPPPADRSWIESIAYSYVDFAGWEITAHGVCAVGFFLALGIVAVFSANDTVEKGSALARIYKIIGYAMVLAPIGAYMVAHFMGKNFGVYLLETAGIYVFATYWGFKTYEFWGTEGQKERELFQGTKDSSASDPPE